MYKKYSGYLRATNKSYHPLPCHEHDYTVHRSLDTNMTITSHPTAHNTNMTTTVHQPSWTLEKITPCLHGSVGPSGTNVDQ